MCSWKRTEEVEIDLLDLLHRLGRQWKRIAVCALVFAVFAGAGSYFAGENSGTDVSQSETAAEPEAEPVPLTEEEQERGVAAAWQLAKETAQLKYYVENSVRMQIDPYHKSSVQLIFRIEGADGWMTQKIVEKYLDYLANDRVVADICKMDSEMERVESRFLSELFQAAQKTSGTYTDEAGNVRSGVLLSVDVTGRDAGMAAALAADIQEVLQTYSSVVKEECASHTFTLLGSEEKERADSDLLAWQREKRTLLAADQANLKAMTDAFDDTQKALYAVATEEDGVQPASEGLHGTDEESGREDTGTESESGSKEEAAQQPDAEEKRSVSMLYVLFGFFGGIFVYGAAYAGWYLLRDTVKSSGEFQSYYMFPFYGSIALWDSGAGQGAYEQQKAQLLNRVRLSCKKQKISRLCLAADFTPDEKEKECMESMISQLREWELDVVFAENISGNISMWDALTDAGTVLMVCKIGHTTHRMVDDAMGFYQENGVAVLGAAALE